MVPPVFYSSPVPRQLIDIFFEIEGGDRLQIIYLLSTAKKILLNYSRLIYWYSTNKENCNGSVFLHDHSIQTAQLKSSKQIKRFGIILNCYVKTSSQQIIILIIA